MNRIHYIALLAGLCALPAQAQHVLTADEAVRLAIRHNLGIGQTLEQSAAARAKITESRSGLYPSVMVTGGYTRLGPISEYTMSMGPAIGPITMKFGSENSYNTTLAIQYAVYDWGRTDASIAASESGVRSAETATSAVQQAVAFQTLQVFYTMVMVQKTIAVFEQTIRTLEHRTAIVGIRFREGLASDYDVLSMSVQLSAARSRKLEAETNLLKLGIQLNRFMGSPAGSGITPDSTVVLRPFPSDVDSLIAAAEAQRPDLRQALTQEEMLLQQERFASTFDKPVVNVGATAGFRNGYYPNLNDPRANWTASLTFSYPLFDGSRVSSQVEQLRCSRNAARLRTEDTRAAIAAEIRQCVADARLQWNKIDIERARAAQARQALSIAEERYEKGFISTVDVLDSQNNCEQAQLSYWQAAASYVIARLAIDRAVGALGSSNQ